MSLTEESMHEYHVSLGQKSDTSLEQIDQSSKIHDPDVCLAISLLRRILAKTVVGKVLK